MQGGVLAMWLWYTTGLPAPDHWETSRLQEGHTNSYTCTFPTVVIFLACVRTLKCMFCTSCFDFNVGCMFIPMIVRCTVRWVCQACMLELCTLSGYRMQVFRMQWCSPDELADMSRLKGWNAGHMNEAAYAQWWRQFSGWPLTEF